MAKSMGRLRRNERSGRRSTGDRRRYIRCPGRAARDRSLRPHQQGRMRRLMALSCLADVARVLRDRDPASALFGPLPPPGPPDEHLDALRRSYRRLAAIVHPDVHPNDVRLATATFQQLETLRAEREQAILEQRY